MLENYERKNTHAVQNSVLSDENKRLIIILMRNYLFLKIYVTSEGAVSYNVLYYQKLSVVRLLIVYFE